MLSYQLYLIEKGIAKRGRDNIACLLPKVTHQQHLSLPTHNTGGIFFAILASPFA